MNTLLDTAVHGWQSATAWLARQLVDPVLATLPAGLRAGAGTPEDIAQAMLVALLQLSIIAFVMRPLESLLPAERWADRRHTTVDRNYTLLMILGLLPLFSFLVLSPLAALFGGAGSGEGAAPQASGLLAWWPALQQHPLAAFAIYYVAYDLTYYWMHRLQHALPWWWALHSLHHSQRQMSCWSNDRTSYIDGVLQSFVLASVGIVLGVDAGQFALLVMASELMQSLSHANLRWGFGPLARLLVSPRFHRLHHMVRDPARPALHDCNFGQVLSVWDGLFRTALHGEPVRPTGVSDPVVDADNARGLVLQQWHVARRFWAAVTCRDGWRLGEVSFGKGLRPVHDPHDEVPVPSAAVRQP